MWSGAYEQSETPAHVNDKISSWAARRAADLVMTGLGALIGLLLVATAGNFLNPENPPALIMGGLFVGVVIVFFGAALVIEQVFDTYENHRLNGYNNSLLLR